ncbi:UNVERIFIED_CONTAM: hypothetical protein Sradi_1997600 [Sesamum radiatum]|uniref:Uncharacterized protein n=1 Tax=Sesamum radiatum TaxID=300843 RepID=A0AAW2TG94_SESRA
MFSSAIRSQYSMQSVNAHYCNCMANSERRSSRSHNNQETDPIQDGHCQPEGDRVNDLASVNHDGPTKDSALRKVESPSSRLVMHEYGDTNMIRGYNYARFIVFDMIAQYILNVCM